MKWPLSTLGLTTIGWRETCFSWALAHIVIGLPLNLLLPSTEILRATAGQVLKPYIPIDRSMVLLSFRRRMDGYFGDGRAPSADRRGLRGDTGAGRVCPA